MGTYAVTGSASGMGKAVADKLRAEGHTVIGVDIKEADVVADLSTPAGRRSAADAVLAASADTSTARCWRPDSVPPPAPSDRT